MNESTKLLSIAVMIIILALAIGATTMVLVIEQQQQQAISEKIAGTNLNFALDDFNDELISGSAIYSMITRGVHVYRYTSEPAALNATHSADLTGAAALTRNEATTLGIRKTNWYRVYSREHSNGVQALVVIIP